MKQYFATLPTDQLLPEIEKRIKNCYKHWEAKGFRRRWDRSYDLYYGRHLGEDSLASGSVELVGEDGELTAFGVNHYRNLIKHILALSTSQKPDFDPRALNTDLESIQQTKIAATVIDSYFDEKRMYKDYVSAAERSLVYGKAFVVKTWDPSLGRPFTTEIALDKDGNPVVGETGEPKEKVVYEGDVNSRAKGPLDVVYDLHLRDWNKKKWIAFREYENKWDLATRHPEHADHLMNLTNDDEIVSEFFRDHTGLEEREDCDDDLIPVWHFVHMTTDAVPNGRLVKMVAGQVALYDGPTPYGDQLPIFRITPGEMFDSSEGYTEAHDLAVLQEVYNTLISIPFTNQQAHAIPVIWAPEGCEFTNSQIGNGPVIARGGPPGSEPKAIQLCATPPEVFTNLDRIQGDMQLISGINSTVRGDPEQNLKSGAALGRMQAMAIQYSSNFQRSWAELLEDGGSFLLFLLRAFAKTERMAARAGKMNRGAMTAFTGESLSAVGRVAVDLGNPMQRTAAGRIEMADKFMEMRMLKNPQQYFTVVKTGNLDPVTEGPESENDLIRKENEALMEGKPAKAIVGDKHLLHAQEHRAVLNDPLIRSKAAEGDPLANQILQMTTEHISEHEQLYMTQAPFFSMISGEPPPPPMAPPGMPPGPGGPMPPPGPGGPPPPDQGPAPQQPADAPPIPPLDLSQESMG